MDYLDADRYENFESARLHDATIATILRCGGTVEDCALALANQNRQLMKRLMELEAISPRRIRLSDGSVLVYRCPDHLVPRTFVATAIPGEIVQSLTPNP